MKRLIVTVLSFVVLSCGALAAQAATLTVTKIADTNDNVCDTDCSLREAIFAAASGDTIEFAAPLFDTAQTIELTPAFGALVPDRSITISGKGANLTTISGSVQIRVFVLVGDVSLVGLRITNGRDVGTGSKYGAGIFNDGNSTITNCIVSSNLVSGTVRGWGGGIYNAPGKQLTIIGSTISGNVATNTGTAGGGIYNDSGGILNIINSTVSGNNAVNRGGGIHTNSTLNITNSTITQNSIAGQDGGGVSKTVGMLRIVNTIISGNNGNSFPGSIHNVFLPAIDLNLQNIIDGDAQLAGLGENGGTTPTFAPASASSPVVNAGNSCVLTENGCGFQHPALTTDQRGAGFPRLSGSAVDIGSVEADAFTFTPATLPAATLNTAYSQQITVTGGIAPHSFTLDSGTLPNGITLSSGGLLSGTTAQPGDFNFTVRATGANGFYALKNYVLSAGYYVTNANSSGTGSLRQLINDAPAGGTIRFDPAFFNVPRTIIDRLDVFKNLTVVGPGSGLLTINGAGGGRVFNMDGGITLTLSGIRFTGGNAGAGVSAGGILVNGGSTFNATDIIVENCSAGVHGGGIYNTGTLNLTNSTVRGNTVGQFGGGIYNGGAAMTVLRSTISGNTGGTGGGVYTDTVSIINNSTISGNTSAFQGGAVFIPSGRRLDTTNSTITNNVSNGNQTGGVANEGLYQARNSIIAGNRNANGAGAQDVSGVITGFGYNLLGSTTGNSYAGNTTGNLVGAALLAPLGDYGGATQTHALFSNSQAINAGDTNNSFATDQRNSTRPIGGRGDIGSFERNIALDQSTLPDGTLSAAYSQTLTVTRLTSFAEDLFKGTELNNLAPFTFAVVSIAGESLPTGLTLSAGGQISGTPTAAGSFTFTVKAIDADGMAGVSQYTILIINTPPTITGSTISRQEGSPVSNSTIANVNDVQSGASGVTVTVTSSNPSNGVTVSNIVNTNGTITANVVAGCGAANASFTLTATDGGGATTTANLNVTVTANSAPTLVYPAAQNIGFGNSLIVTPTTASDNGTISYSILSVSPTLTTAPTVDLNGVVSITNAQPLGDHIITVRATDDCGLITDASFTLNVAPPVRTVTKTDDTDDGICSADCSLREAIVTAVSGDTIQFAAPLFDSAQIITLTSELSVTGKTITIRGRAANLTAVSGENTSRAFNVGSGGNLTLDNLTVKNGRNTDAGGGIYNGATLTVTNSTVSDNSVSGGSDNFGGGIYNASQATLTIRNSTISGNSVTGSSNFANRGGGIANAGGTLIITNSTVSGNSLGGGTNNRGGGIYSESGTLTIINDTIFGNFIPNGGSNFNYGGGLATVSDTVSLSNTIISGNSSAQNPDVFGSVNENFNFIGGDARLAPLGFYGGTTQTYALLSDSPVLNAGNNCVLTLNGCAGGNEALTTDQRGAGAARKIGANVDTGAFEGHITFNQSTLPNGTHSAPYDQTLTVTRLTSLADNQISPAGGNNPDSVEPFTFTVIPVAGQSLPTGLSLSPSGQISGTPTTSGSFTFTVKATDADGMAGASQYTIAVVNSPTASDGTVTGRIADDQGNPVEGAVVRLSGSQNRKFITDTNGFYRFENVETGGFYNVTPSRVNYTFSPSVISFTQIGETTNATFGATRTGELINPLDRQEYFVRQQYLDFLNREPDEAGFNFWSDQILGCGTDVGCTERMGINVSAAFFLSIEFQQTGGLVDGLYRASYGRRPQFAEFMPDTRRVAQGVVVGRAGWQAQLEANKQAFVESFASRPGFKNAFSNMSDEVFVETLISHTGVSSSAGERQALISGLSNGALTRAGVLRRVAENQHFVRAKFNEAFVLMQYFGYLRRDPDESGYQFWLNKLNQFNGNFEQAEMVKAFIVSGEYRQRFRR